MPRTPSANGIPRQYILSDELIENESRELAFQRSINGRNYLRWYTIARKALPSQTYLVVSYGNIREVVNGKEILDQTLAVVTNHSCTFTNRITAVPDHYVIPFDQLYSLLTNGEEPSVDTRRSSLRLYLRLCLEEVHQYIHLRVLLQL